MNLRALIDTSDRRRLFWQLQTIGWGITLIVNIWLVMYWPAQIVLVLGVGRVLIGFLASSFLLRPVLHRIRKKGDHISSGQVAFIAGFCLLLGLGDAALVSGLTHVLEASHSQVPGVEQFVVFSIALRAVVYAFWSLLYLVINHSLDVQENQLRVAQREAAMKSSELQVLRGQVNPHFLFNALNSILAESGNPSAVQRITLSLAEYLRFSLRQPNDTDQLGTELNALESYLRVEKARFEENLEYQIEADATARRTQAPVALIQPLLENAIKYGQLSPLRPLTISIVSLVQGGFLSVTVTNSGGWVEPGSKNSTGIGLANLRRRLQLLYGDRAALTINPGQAKVEARVTLPVQEREP